MEATATFAQIAQAIGMSPEGARRLAEKQAWEFVEVPSKGRNGKRREFPIATLPLDVRKALAAAQPAGPYCSLPDPEAAEQARKLALELKTARAQRKIDAEAALAAAQALPEREQQRNLDRCAILTDWQAYRRLSGESVNPSLASYADLYNAGSRQGLEAVRGRIPEVFDSTLQKWRRKLKEQGHLGANYGNAKGLNKLDTQPELKLFVEAMLTEFPHCKPAQVIQGLRARFGNRADLSLPSQGRLGVWMEGWKAKNAQLYSSLSNPDGWKNEFMTAFGSASQAVVVLNQLWELDGTPADLMFTDGRHALCGNIDVYSRRPKLLVTPTSKATAVAALLRRCLLDWGLPAEPWHLTAKTDNGSDYTAHHIRRVFEALEIEQVLCPPFSPWHKPHIERFFRTFSHDLVELLPGFIGHNVAERKSIEARKAFSERLFKKDEVIQVNMTAADFQAFCDEWINNIYMHRQHEGLNGKTPYQMVSEWREPQRRIRNERALDLLLAEAPGNNGKRTGSKKGIKLDHGHFIAPELWAYVGQEVRVLYDPVDLGRIQVYGGPEFNEFVCIAECPERTGMDRAEVAAQAKALQTKTMQEAKAALKASAKKLNIAEVVNEIRAAAAIDAGKLVSLPRPSTEYTSAGLRASAEAASALALDDAKPKVAADISTPEAQYARWKRLEAREAAGETLYAEDAAFFKGFSMSADWRAMQKMEEDFGAFYLAHK